MPTTMAKPTKHKTEKPKMGRPPGQTYPAEDSPIQARLTPEMRTAFRELAARNGVREPEELRVAIREHLLRNSLWPPKPIEDKQ